MSVNKNVTTPDGHADTAGSTPCTIGSVRRRPFWTAGTVLRRIRCVGGRDGHGQLADAHGGIRSVSPPARGKHGVMALTDTNVVVVLGADVTAAYFYGDVKPN